MSTRYDTFGRLQMLPPPSRRHIIRRRLPCTALSFLFTIVLSFACKAASALVHGEPTFSTSGQRYLCVPTAAAASTSSSDRKDDATPPPLLILPGTAQSHEIWQPQVSILSQTRSVVICEPLGIGLRYVPSDLSMPSQAEALRQTLEEIRNDPLLSSSSSSSDDDRSWDVAGFSLGGRIAMALACLDPAKIRRLHLTGVAKRRSDWGTLQIAAWKDLLQHGPDLRPFAWSALLASYSPEFLIKQRDRFPLWIDSVCQRHTLEGLRRLVLATHDEDDDDDSEWSVAAMAQRFPSDLVGRLCVGEGDQLAPVHEVRTLAKALQWPEPTIIPRAAHVPPIENPLDWRRDLQEFIK